MAKKGHYQGKKHRGKHTTVIPIVEELIKVADRLPQVTGIVPSFIDQKAKSRKPRVEFNKIPAGLEVTAFGSTSKQTVLLYTSHPDVVEQILNAELV